MTKEEALKEARKKLSQAELRWLTAINFESEASDELHNAKTCFEIAEDRLEYLLEEEKV